MTPLATVPLHPLAQGIMGEGIVVLPFEGKLVAPFSGKILRVLPNQHVLTLKSDSGFELLIHLGINSKEAANQFFQIKKTEGSLISKGEVLVEFDLIALKKAGIDSRSMVILLNQEGPRFLWNEEIDYLAPFVEIEENVYEPIV